MCSFYLTEIFFNPRLEHVTYYMCMDTDLCFTAPPCYDPFEAMHAQQHLYGYLGIGQDGQDFTEGMYHFIQNYAKACALVENMLCLNNWAWSHRDENGPTRVMNNMNAHVCHHIQNWNTSYQRPDSGLLDNITYVPTYLVVTCSFHASR